MNSSTGDWFRTTVGARQGCKDRQKKRWEGNIKEWTGMDFASSTWAVEDRSRLRGIVAKSSCGAPTIRQGYGID